MSNIHNPKKPKGLKSISRLFWCSQKNISNGRAKKRSRHQLRSLKAARCQSPSGEGVPGFGVRGTCPQAWTEPPRKEKHFRCHHVLHEVSTPSCPVRCPLPTPCFTCSPPSMDSTQNEVSSHTFYMRHLSRLCFLLIHKGKTKFKCTLFLCYNMTLHSQTGFGNTHWQPSFSIETNLKAGFVPCSSGTEVVQESCLKICFIIVGISGDEKRGGGNPHQNPQTTITRHPKNPCTVSV